MRAERRIPRHSELYGVASRPVYCGECNPVTDRSMTTGTTQENDEVGRMAGTPRPLRMRRLALGLTQLEVASRAGISRNQVARLEVETHGPRLSTIRALARALDCDPAAIFSLHGPANDERLAARPGVVTTSGGQARHDSA